MAHIKLTDIADYHVLLTNVRDFLANQGWIIDAWEHDATSYRDLGTPPNEGFRLHVHKDEVHVHLRSATRASVYEFSTNNYATVDGVRQFTSQLTGIAGYASDGFDGQKAWDKQGAFPGFREDRWSLLGCSYGAGIRIAPGVIPSCHIVVHENPAVVHLAVEHSIGAWRHLVAGQLSPLGNAPGAFFHVGSGINRFFAGSRYFDQFMGGESDGNGTSGGAWAPSINSNSYSNGWLYFHDGLTEEGLHTNSATGKFFAWLLECSAPTFSGVHPLIPIQFNTYVRKDLCTASCLLGHMPHAYLTKTSIDRGKKSP